MTAASTGRVTARIPQHIQETLEYAATLAGATLNQFMVQASLKEAETVIERNKEIHHIVLSARDYQKIWALIENPPPPNQKLQEAFKKHQAFFRAQD